MKHIIVALLLMLFGILCKAQDRSAQITRVLAARATSPLPSRIQSAHASGIRLELRGIYVLDGLLWFNILVSNTSVFDWHGTPMRFSIRDRHVLRRRARQELPQTPIVRRESLHVHSDSAVTLVYALSPRLPTKSQFLLLEYSDRTGDRHLVLRLTANQLLHAKKLDSDAKKSDTNGNGQNTERDPRPQQMAGPASGR